MFFKFIHLDAGQDHAHFLFSGYAVALGSLGNVV